MSSISRRTAAPLGAIAALLSMLPASPTAETLSAAEGRPASAERPNIVLILVDDLGFADLGCYGGEIRTPHVDALARSGTRWTRFYNCAQCCPTRASLMSGLYPHQAGVGDMIDDHSRATRDAAASPAYSDRLSPDVPTIAEVLRPAGYRTLMVGKWHLGKGDGQRPVHRGFDRYYGIIAGADSYRKPATLRLDDEPVREFEPGFYLTDALTDKAIEFVEACDARQPFFLYVAYNAPHTPFHARPEDVERYRGTYDVGWDAVRERRFARQKEAGFWPADLSLPPRTDPAAKWTRSEEQMAQAARMEIYAGMVDRIDRNVGRLMERLERTGRLDDTLVMFLSDNGAWAAKGTYGTEWAETGNTPFRLYKVFTHEGGIRAPFVARWPKRIPAGTLNTIARGHVKDLLPTCLAAAGAEYPSRRNDRPLAAPAGRNLLPSLEDPRKVEPTELFWERRGHGAMQDGRWKIVRFYGDPGRDGSQLSLGPRTGRWELYDLESDPVEAHDLAAAQPDRLRSLVERYEAWEKRVGVVDRSEIARRIEAAPRP